MITNETPDRLSQLCDTIVSAGDELADLVRGLSTEADQQLAEAALAFVAEHGKDKQNAAIYASYQQAHDRLVKLAIAASNIKEVAQRANTFRQKSAWWGGLMERGQQSGDIRLVCDGASNEEKSD